ncbi:hypothetical protein MRB53_040468 [Persea americana]|nr:hypothetical protein MRB53_040468 [Persea americana]
MLTRQGPATRHCQQSKALIVGQDPYHNINQAHGCASPSGRRSPRRRRSKNMYIALKKDYPDFKAPPKNGGLLTPWADRGVLLLNTCLTVRAHEANSHAGKGWEKFTQKVIDVVAKERSKGVVFLAWGSPAQKRCVLSDTVQLDCGHFKAANVWLKERYGEDGQIDWNLDVPPEQAGV